MQADKNTSAARAKSKPRSVKAFARLSVQIGARLQLNIKTAARPVAELQQRFGDHSALIANAITHTGRPAEALRSLPLITRKGEWTVLIDAQTTLPVGFVPLDSF